MQRNFLVSVLGLSLLLWHTPGLKGEARVVGSRTVIALAGDDVTLPCRRDPPVSAVGLTVEWTRPDLQPEYVLVFAQGRDEYHLKNPSYKHRTALFLEELQKGNVSLRLSRVQLSDQGQYRCFLPSLKSQVSSSATVQLVVGSISQPKISTVESKAGGVVLRCEAKSWYPEPEMEWREKEGRVLAADYKDTVKDPDGRYTITSYVTVRQTASNWFICRVTLDTLNQTREEETHILAVLFAEGKTSEPRGEQAIIVTVIGAAVGIVVAIAIAVVILVWFLRRYRPEQPVSAPMALRVQRRRDEKGEGETERVQDEDDPGSDTSAYESGGD